MSEYAALASMLSVAYLLTSGAVALMLRAHQERMRREVTAEITESRHDVRAVISGVSAELHLALDKKVDGTLYAAQMGECQRRLSRLERVAHLNGE